MSRRQPAPNAFLGIQALQSGLGVQGSAEAADPDHAEARPASPVLHFNDCRGIDYAGRAIQAGAPAADIVGVGILLKRMAKGVYPAYAHA